MKVRYTFRCYPTPSQRTHLAQVFGHTRFVYNWALRYRIDAYARGEKPNYNTTSAALTALKKTEECAWLKDVSCVPLQQGLRHLQTAYTNFFAGRGKFPAFKSKRHKQSAEFTASAFTYKGDVLSLAKVGPLKVVWSRPFVSQPTTVTISKTPSGRYYVTLCLDEPAPAHYPKTGESVGIDLGISQLATLSTGEIISNPRHTKKHEKRLAKAQRILSRKTKGSGRWNRQRVKVARIHETIAACRKDHLDKVTTALVRKYDVIAIEDLYVRGMVKNRKLAKHISDASFGTFRAMLTYKCAWRGRELLTVNRFYPSSKTCSCCGQVVKVLPLSVRKWTCQGCNAEHDRDENAAKNILTNAVEHTVNAHGATGRPASPTRVGGGLR